MNLIELPSRVLMHVYSFLDYKDVGRGVTVCKKLNKILKQDWNSGKSLHERAIDERILVSFRKCKELGKKSKVPNEISLLLSYPNENKNIKYDNVKNAVLFCTRLVDVDKSHERWNKPVDLLNEKNEGGVWECPDFDELKFFELMLDNSLIFRLIEAIGLLGKEEFEKLGEFNDSLLKKDSDSRSVIIADLLPFVALVKEFSRLNNKNECINLIKRVHSLESAKKLFSLISFCIKNKEKIVNLNKSWVEAFFSEKD